MFQPGSLKGSEVWAPVVEVVFDGVTMGFKGFRIGPKERTIGSTLCQHIGRCVLKWTVDKPMSTT